MEIVEHFYVRQFKRQLNSEKYSKIASQEVYKEATLKQCRSQIQGPTSAIAPTQ